MASVGMLETMIQEQKALIERYESRLRLTLHVAELVIPLERIGPGEIVMREPYEVPMGPACVEVYVDGVLLTWNVWIVDSVGRELEVQDD